MQVSMPTYVYDGKHFRWVNELELFPLAAAIQFDVLAGYALFYLEGKTGLKTAFIVNNQFP